MSISGFLPDFKKGRREAGQTLAEYSLIVSILAIALVATLAVVGGTVIEFFISTGDLVADSIS